MTANENIQLERIEEKIDTLNNFMATYTEKSKHCAKAFGDIDGKISEIKKVSEWNRNKIIAFMAIFGAIIWAIGKFIR